LGAYKGQGFRVIWAELTDVTASWIREPEELTVCLCLRMMEARVGWVGGWVGG